MPHFDVTIPVLVAGGGACGATAALSAVSAGAEVLVIEQDLHPLGSTSMSQGLICAANTKSQRENGIEDSADIFFEDIIEKTRGETCALLALTIADGSGPALDWLVEHEDLPWSLDTAFRAAYGHSRKRVHGWPGHSGEDMIRLLHKRLADRSIDVLLGARLTSIIHDGAGKALGVEITRPDSSIEQIGCDTLILATSGFAANRDMVSRYMPAVAQARYNGHEGNRGDGIILGAGMGGALADMGSYQGYGMLAIPHGVTVPPGFLMDGGILLNSEGRRFVDESADIAGVIHPVLAQPDGVVWVVYDRRIADGLAHIPEAAQLAALKAPREAPSMAALAAIIGADPRRLRRTFQSLREAHAAGAADGFGRPWGDMPPAAPFYALKATGALYHTQGGLQVDREARVLRANGVGLANVFAGGGAARGVSGPSSWGYLPAMGLCEAITLGRAAGLAAARQVLGAVR